MLIVNRREDDSFVAATCYLFIRSENINPLKFIYIFTPSSVQITASETKGYWMLESKKGAVMYHWLLN